MSPPLSSTSLGISEERNTQLALIAGRIQMEIEQEYGSRISRVHVVKGVLSSPWPQTETERAWIVATLCEALAARTYFSMLLEFRMVWKFWDALYPDWTIEERMTDICTTARTRLKEETT